MVVDFEELCGEIGKEGDYLGQWLWEILGLVIVGFLGPVIMGFLGLVMVEIR